MSTNHIRYQYIPPRFSGTRLEATLFTGQTVEVASASQATQTALCNVPGHWYNHPVRFDRIACVSLVRYVDGVKVEILETFGRPRNHQAYMVPAVQEVK